MARELQLLQALRHHFNVPARDVTLLAGPVARVGMLHFRLDDAGTLRVWAGEHHGWTAAQTLAQLSEVLIGATSLTPPSR